MEETTNKTCNCAHHKFIPALIILIAAIFLLGALDVISQKFVSIAWPIILGVGGFLKLGARSCKCC